MKEPHRRAAASRASATYRPAEMSPRGDRVISDSSVLDNHRILIVEDERLVMMLIEDRGGDRWRLRRRDSE
jgi:hypothetical protein